LSVIVFNILASSEDFSINFGVFFFNDISGFEKFFHGIDLKKMFVLSKFVGESFPGLGENWSLSSGLSSIKFDSQDGDGVKSVLVLFQLLNEKLVSLTSGDVQLDEFVGDGLKSSLDPVEMVIRILHLCFDPFSVTGGGFSDFLVSLRDGGELHDGGFAVSLLLTPTIIMFSLFFIDRILKFAKEFLDSVNGISSHGL